MKPHFHHSHQEIQAGSSGFCLFCRKEHALAPDPAISGCLELMRCLEDLGRIDIHISQAESNPLLSTDYLFGPARGKMFGVMVCRNGDSLVTLKAFSGQYNGLWEVEDWVPPLFDVREFSAFNDPGEKEIKHLGREIERLDRSSLERIALIRKRKKLSQALMQKIHSLYRVPNFHGEEKSLFEIFPPDLGIPTGTGDCCAPKLLGFAARRNLVPLGMAEFYWGEDNKSRTRIHGRFYPACRERCRPLLGHMLCGLTSPGSL